jgi:GT2 family glycosyltransferase
MTHTSPSSPTVSIITPAFNAEQYIEQTIESVLRQTFDGFEMVIVDDGSIDGTAAIAARYARRDARIRLIRQANRGIAAARNAGLAASRGRYIALLDSDDAWLPSYLSDQLAVLERRPDIAVLSANALNVGGPSDGEPLLPMKDDGAVVPISLLTLIEREDAVSIFSVFRRDLLQAIGGFDDTLRRSEDYDLWLRAAAAGLQIAVNPRPLGLYRRRPDSLSADETLMLDAMRHPLAKVRERCGGRPEIRSAVDRQLAALTRRRLVARARAALAQGDMTALAARFAALADATGARRYRVASWLAGTAPMTIRWAYSCKRTFGHLSGARRRTAAPRTSHRTRRAGL